jgi:hypothetical protein
MSAPAIKLNAAIISHFLSPASALLSQARGRGIRIRAEYGTSAVGAAPRTSISVDGTLVAGTGSWSMTTVARGYIGECCGYLTSYPLHLFLLADRGVPAGQGALLQSEFIRPARLSAQPTRSAATTDGRRLFVSQTRPIGPLRSVSPR